MPIKRILLATDLSESAKPAAHAAGALAEQTGAELTVVTVLEPLPGVYAAQLEGGAPGILDGVYRDLNRELTEFVAAKFKGLSGVQARVVQGKAADAVIKAATDAKADVIVMGTQGRTGLSRLLLGSTAEKVLRQSPVPVMTVPAGRG